ncbi:hypothetical protein SISSUDRAFT_324291 [Sistotremastrum suecicum HHB10207 ss-3]|uniref:Uncharacterized protein n=1 Tax=Sistotremastrum suecicum HHB10207 ss-3 TaxID=1314776 RepID=A0A166IS13_9AGAM|nr:hypothetical protein SISSUDRAFT_324291 [Sistotremastrum suecicum HHB10207 ss-3]
MASSTSGPSPARSAGAALYSHAMSSFNRQSTAPSEEPQPVIKPKPSGSGANQPQSERRHPTAEEEKAALRYHEAKRAVRQQGQPEPIPYEILYPAQDSSHVENYTESESTTTTHSSPTTQPNLHQTSLRAGSGSVNKDANSMASPLLSHHNGEESGNGSAGSSMHDDTDIRSQRVTTSRSRSGKGNTLPQPPSLPAGLTPGSSLPLTAAQEKARLKAQYDAEESRPVSSSPGNRQPGGQLRETFASAETMRRDPSISQGKKRALHDPNISPPPLPPRPPAEYLVETQMEDARTRAEEERLAAAMSNTSDNLPYDQSSIEASDLGSSDPGLSSANPPPLPPKVPIE